MAKETGDSAIWVVVVAAVGEGRVTMLYEGFECLTMPLFEN